MIRLIFTSSLLWVILAVPVQSQDQPQAQTLDPFQQIDHAYQQGEISLDQKVLLKFSRSEAKDILSDTYDTDSKSPLKCGTPAYSDYYQYKDQLSPSTINQVESQIQPGRLQASETYQSPDGHFSIHYETSGEHAVPPGDSNNNGIPDYVEEVAAAADSSYRHEVKNLGYTDPLGKKNQIDIYILDLSDENESLYGRSNGTSIEIENDFSEAFPPNDDPEGNQIGAIKVTVAHELKHVIQYSANNWQGETDDWLEMDATLMEEVVYDNVNDYYNYLDNYKSIFNDPKYSFYLQVDGDYYFTAGSYYHVSWALFFEEKYGSQFWVDVWKIIKKNPYITMLNAVTQKLGGNNAFKRDYIESQLWHYASGDNAVKGFGFEERQHYPTPATNYDFVGDNSLTTPDILEGFSASYSDIAPSPFPGSIELSFSDFKTPSAGFGVLIYNKNGEAEPLYFLGNQQSNITHKSKQWSKIEKIGLVATNSFVGESTPYAFAIQSVNPQVTRVEQNYPNPFNNQTTIRYSISERKEVQLEIFDVLGRKIATLVDRSQPKGIYTEQFNGQSYSSGIYFYRLIIDGEVTTKKMTLVK